MTLHNVLELSNGGDVIIYVATGSFNSQKTQKLQTQKNRYQLLRVLQQAVIAKYAQFFRIVGIILDKTCESLAQNFNGFLVLD